MRFSALLLVGVLCTFFQAPAQQNFVTQHDSSIIVNISEYDSAGTPIDLEGLNWKFNPGHNPEWADPDYNDSDWHTLSPQSDSLLAVKDSLWKGHGWFRLTFTADSSFYEIPRHLEFDSYGAAEVYIDGRKIDSYGSPALSLSEENLPTFLPTLYPTLGLNQTREHVLAVRYSFHNQEKLQKLSYTGDIGIGFSIHIHRAEQYLSQYRSELNIDLAFLVSLVVLLMITLLHFSFYIKFPNDEDNFWVFLVTLHLSIVVGLLFQYRFLDVKGMLSVGSAYLMSYAFFQFCCMIPIALSSLLETQKHSFWKYLPAAGVLIAVCHFLVMKSSESGPQNFANVIPVLVLLYVLVAGSLIIWEAKQLQRENIWIVATGFLTLPILCLATIFIMIVTVFGFGPTTLENFLPYLIRVVIILSILSLPICMSVYVGTMFFDLYGDLESQVEKRTKELHEKNQELEQANQEIQQQRDEVAEARDNLEKALHELQETQDQLVQQEKLASLGQLTAGIAHEIKNPLNFVNNFSDLSVELVEEAREEIKNSESSNQNSEVLNLLDDVEMNLKKINEHGNRADGIVRSMLQHSRGGDGEMESTDLNALVEEYVNLSFHGMRASEHPINVDIELDLGESVGEIPLIAEDFSRVILNLCNNAFDAMREKLSAASDQPSANYQPTLSVRTKSGNGEIVIEIEDNGPGIPEDIRGDIMQPFFTTKEGTEGTGLGLSITNDIVKAHGGEIHLESDQSGTKIGIQIPNDTQ